MENSEIDFIELKNKCQKCPSRIYGFIIYTRAHSYITKVLRDNDFWNELDEISGPNWPIFAAKPLEEGFIRDSWECDSLKSNYKPKSKSDYCGMMSPIWHKPNENKKVLRWFGLENSKDLPCMLIFAWNDKDCLDRIIWKLSNESLEKAFNSIRDVVKIVTETESYILSDYKQSVRVFENVRDTLEATMFRRGFLQSVSKITRIKDMIQSLIGF